MTTLQEYHFIVARSPFEITAEDVFLDVGCGFGRLGAVLKYVEDRKAPLVGVDIYLPDLKICKTRNIYDYLILCDARHLPFKEKTFTFLHALKLLNTYQKKAVLK